MNYNDKILGGLYGQALGDAFGMPALFHPRDTWEKIGWIESFLPAPDDHHVHAGLPAGRITDDSEQAFSIAQAYIRHGGVSVAAAVEALLAWYDRVGGDESPYVGPSTKRGVTALRRGDDPYTTGLWGDTNGAAMRIAPVGLMFPGNVVGAVENAVLTCVPTHYTGVAVGGACAVAAAVAVAMLPDVTLDAVVAAGILGAELGMEKAPRWLGPSTARKIEQAVAIARSAGDDRRRLMRLYDEVGTSLSVPETVGAAFGTLVMASGDPMQTAVYAANLSGDADTVGAIACAMAGTYAGFAAFPESAVNTLNNDEVFASYDVPAIADGIEKLIAAP
ncbi:MAG: ADP-ribosylglycohydrolase family protein [Chloroflexota bacterium]